MYANKFILGFDEVDTTAETQVLELTEKDYQDGVVVPLRFVKYQNVTSIVLFIESNLGNEDSTKIERLIFYRITCRNHENGRFQKSRFTT